MAISTCVFDVEACSAISSGVFDVEACSAVSSGVFESISDYLNQKKNNMTRKGSWQKTYKDANQKDCLHPHKTELVKSHAVPSITYVFHVFLCNFARGCKVIRNLIDWRTPHLVV